VKLNGAGSVFPGPLYQNWSSKYSQQNPNILVSYLAVGNEDGVKQFTAEKVVDFAASDDGLKPDEISKVSKGVLMVPMAAGSVVIAYNLPELTNVLKLSRSVYSDIFLGNITHWRDPRIARDNPGVEFPNLPIAVVHRSDKNSTTAIFTKHLSAVSPAWKAGPRVGKSIRWPVGKGAKESEGVVAQIQNVPGAIGYLNFGYAKRNKVHRATLENKAGEFVEATPNSTVKALATAKLSQNFLAFVADPEGPDSYPIVSYTWLLVYKQYDDPNTAKAVEDFLKWSLKEGQKTTPQLGYAPLPQAVVSQVEPVVDTISR